MNKMSRPVLRYHGGKFRIADWVLSFFPDHECYLEPFGGGASVLMNKWRVGTEIYNDLDSDVVNLFRVLRDSIKAEELRRLLSLTPFARDEFDQAYQLATNEIEQARNLIIRSFMGHGSDSATRRSKPGFRTKRSKSESEGGGFTNSPACEFSTYSQFISQFHERLGGVVVENRPAIDLIKQFDSASTLIYVDPPYVLSSRTLMSGSLNSSNGYRHEMTDDDHRVLSDCLHKSRAMVVISGYGTQLYDKELYADWCRFERRAYAEQGKARTEVVWINQACKQALEERNYQEALFA